MKGLPKHSVHSFPYVMNKGKKTEVCFLSNKEEYLPQDFYS